MKGVQGLAFATALGVCLVTPVGPALAKLPSVQAAPRIRVVETDNSKGFAVPGFDGKFLQVMIPDPPMVAMETVYRDKTDGGLPVMVKRKAGHPFSAIKAESNSPFIRPTVALAPDGTRAYVVTTEIDPAIPKGELKGAYVRISTTHPKKPALSIPAVQPARLFGHTETSRILSTNKIHISDRECVGNA